MAYYEPDSFLVVLLHTVRDGSGCEARRCERGKKAFVFFVFLCGCCLWLVVSAI